MTIDINKRSGGSTELPVAECIDGHMSTWRVRTDFQPVLDEQEKQTGVSFIEKEYPYKPSMNEVRDFVCAVINAQTDEKILNGYQFTPDGAEEPITVWLSEENQRNFSEAQRLQIIPVKFKLNETEDKQPIYHTFETFEELDRFYKGGVQYINQCLSDGWQQKDSVDFTPYEEILNPVTE